MRRALRLMALVITASLGSGTAALAQSAPPAPPLPPITEADRRAAFPQLTHDAGHGNAIHSLVRVDELEWQVGGRESALTWEQQGWVGGDIQRFWFRTQGEADDSHVAAAEVHALYGRAVARWWEVVAGIRQDFRPGSPQTWAAVGLQGLAPYWFHVEVTAYVGRAGRTALRAEAEYEVLVTNRLVLQPLAEITLHGKDDPDRGIGAGFTDTELGLRLRYEIRPELAPYVGVTWHRKLGATADLARASGEPIDGARAVVGLRFWF